MQHGKSSQVVHMLFRQGDLEGTLKTHSRIGQAGRCTCCSNRETWEDAVTCIRSVSFAHAPVACSVATPHRAGGVAESTEGMASTQSQAQGAYTSNLNSQFDPTVNTTLDRNSVMLKLVPAVVTSSQIIERW
jgi:hypothetical protein